MSFAGVTYFSLRREAELTASAADCTTTVTDRNGRSGTRPTTMTFLRPKVLFPLLCVGISGLILLQMQLTKHHTFRPTSKSQSQDTSQERLYDVNRDPAIQVPGEKNIVLGCAVTTRNIPNPTKDVLLVRMPLFQHLIPSFCKTGSAGYSYHFYLSHDHNDPFFSRKNSHQEFEQAFTSTITKLCPKTFNVTLNLVECGHMGHPAWAQNDAMFDAYLDNMPYYYRVNDDSVMETPGWSEAFVGQLAKYSPPNVGVVGPRHRGGNEAILTYDCVHKSHLDIHGYYYPRAFTDWFADDWVTIVYRPDRSTKLQNIHLQHTMSSGTRYSVRKGVDKLVKGQVDKGRKVMHDYINAGAYRWKPNLSGERIISFSLYGADPRYTYGAVRNAQLVPIYFPTWRARFYVENPNGTTRHTKVPMRILTKLRVLGAEVHYMDSERAQLAPMLWRFLVAQDPRVKRFIIRDADSRLNTRDAAVVHEWEKSGKAFHCIRDHPSHSNYAVSGGLWGGVPSLLNPLLPKPWPEMLRGVGAGYVQDMDFLGKSIWPKVSAGNAYCHDSFSCKRYPGSHPFPVEREEPGLHLGAVHDPFGVIRQGDIDILVKHAVVKECTDPGSKLPEPATTSKPTTPAPPATTTSIVTTTRALTTGTTAPPAKTWVFWSNDFHISPINDLKNLLQPLGVKFIDKSLSGHCQVTNTCARDLKVINGGNAMDLKGDLKQRFYQAYKDDPLMKTVSAFVCFHPASMCELFMPFNKTLIVIASTRYELGRFDPQRWKEWNTNLITISKNPRNIVAGNNRYDQEYIRYFTGINAKMFPSFCGYINLTYSPVEGKPFLLSPVHKSGFQQKFLEGVQAAKTKLSSKIEIRPLRDVYDHYEFKDLVNHPAIVYIPYQVSVMSLFEQYRLNIPLFFPSVQLLTTWQVENNVMNERTWDSVFGSIPSKSKIPGVVDEPDPNNDKDRAAVQFWIKFSDFYEWPHVQYYESYEDLLSKLSKANFKEISNNMKAYNVQFKTQLIEKWKKVLETIPK